MWSALLSSPSVAVAAVTVCPAPDLGGNVIGRGRQGPESAAVSAGYGGVLDEGTRAYLSLQEASLSGGGVVLKVNECSGGAGLGPPQWTVPFQSPRFLLEAVSAALNPVWERSLLVTSAVWH